MKRLIIPNRIKRIDERTFKIDGDTIFFRSLPKNIASKLLKIIPKVEANSKIYFESGYLEERQIEETNVLSPNSPINIKRATDKIEERLEECVSSAVRNLGTLCLEVVSCVGINPKNPSTRKLIPVNICKCRVKLLLVKFARDVPKKIASP